MAFRTTFRTYLGVTILNAILIFGGFLAGVAYRDHAVAHAQTSEEISPVVTAGSAAFGTLLAGRFASDEITIQGIDVLKLQEATLNLIARKTFTPVSELQAAVDSAKAPHPLRLRQQTPPKSEPPAVTKKDGK
jgi:hypothetical protein